MRGLVIRVMICRYVRHGRIPMKRKRVRVYSEERNGDLLRDLSSERLKELEFTEMTVVIELRKIHRKAALNPLIIRLVFMKNAAPYPPRYYLCLCETTKVLQL